MRTLIILVNWRRPIDTIECLKSLDGLTFKGFDVALCDNSPWDQPGKIVEFLKAGADEFFIEKRQEGESLLIRRAGRQYVVMNSNGNLGFAGGNNAAYKAAIRGGNKWDYFWFLNNDTEVEPDCLEHLIAKIKSGARIGICGSTLVYGEARSLVQALGGSSYNPWLGLMKEIGNRTTWPQQVLESEIEQELSYVAGASMLVSADFIERVGLMCEDYFLYFEEIDWAVRAKQHGFLLAYASKAVVYHKEGVAIGTGKGSSRSQLAEYYGLRNKLIITGKFFPWAFLSVWLISWLQVIRRISYGRINNARLMAKLLLGIKDSENEALRG